MKRIRIYIILMAALCALLSACGLDNYDAPEAKLTGRVTYNGNPVGVRGSNESVRLQLWQDGFPLKTPIDVFVTQDGSFSSSLFNGTYKLVTVSGNGPWAHTSDTLVVNISGQAQVDFPVQPYFALSDIQYELQGTELVATCRVAQLDASKTLEEINLLINDTQFVDLGHFIARETSTSMVDGQVTLRIDIADELSSSSAIFARVGLKINGITEAVYDSQIEKIK